jgi:hypothetical protein
MMLGSIKRVPTTLQMTNEFISTHNPTFTLEAVDVRS